MIWYNVFFGLPSFVVRLYGVISITVFNQWTESKNWSPINLSKAELLLHHLIGPFKMRVYCAAVFFRCPSHSTWCDNVHRLQASERCVCREWYVDFYLSHICDQVFCFESQQNKNNLLSKLKCTLQQVAVNERAYADWLGISQSNEKLDTIRLSDSFVWSFWNCRCRCIYLSLHFCTNWSAVIDIPSVIYSTWRNTKHPVEKNV